MRTSGPRSAATRLRRLRALGVLAAGLLLAGCVTMPDRGAPPPLSGDANSAQQQQVVVVAEPPKAGDQPVQLLSGFLDDLVSDESDYHTARMFLGARANESWKPEQQVVTVLDSIRPTVLAGSTSTTMTIEVSGHEVATLDARHALTPASGGGLVHMDFTFVKGPKGWQIDSLPSGLILKQEDFQRIYESVDLYFPVAGALGGGAPSALVADPVYLRSHIDPLSDAAHALLDGPSDWLAPAVEAGFPAGTTLGDPTVDVSSDGSVDLHLGGGAEPLLRNDDTCERMAAQLYFTLSQVQTQQAKQAGAQVNEVSLYRKGSTTADCTSGSGSPYSPLQSATGGTAYFVGATGRLESMDVSAKQVVPQVVGAALAPPTAGRIGGFAVAPGVSGKVAVLSHDQRALYVSTLTQPTAPIHPLVTSAVVHGLSAPSWDDLGTLWVVDTDPAAPQQLRAVVGNTVVPVTLSGLRGRVVAARVAADGARIALTVSVDGTTSVEVGRVQRSGTAKAPQLLVAGVRAVAPTVTGIKSASWADGDSLIVLGQRAGSAKGLSVWEIDGSSAVVPGPQPPSTLDGMSTVTALQQDPDPNKAPFLADSSGSDTPDDMGKIYRWEQSMNSWQVLTATGDPAGPMPSYPG